MASGTDTLDFAIFVTEAQIGRTAYPDAELRRGQAMTTGAGAVTPVAGNLVKCCNGCPRQLHRQD